jgi:hypothetical protein
LKDQVLVREWIVIAFVGGAILTLGAVSHFSKIQISHSFAAEKERFLKEAYLKVVVSGAVENPGEYTVPRGSTLKDLLKLAKLTKQADRRKIVMKKVMEEGDQIDVPAKMPRSKKRIKKQLGAVFLKEEKKSLCENQEFC